MAQNFDQAKRDNTFWPTPNILGGSVYIFPNSLKFFQTSLNNKNSFSFSHKELLLTLIFAPKIMELQSVFLSCICGPLKLLRPLKKAQILDSWPKSKPKKTRHHWIGLIWKKCPVSRWDLPRRFWWHERLDSTPHTILVKFDNRLRTFDISFFGGN